MNPRTLHRIVERERGKASAHSCTDCGGSAKEWSRTHGAQGISVSDYSPRCIPCHRIYDGDSRGELNGQSKLTEPEVLSIKKLCAEGILSQREIASIYEVSQSRVSKIVNGLSWRHNG